MNTLSESVVILIEGFLVVTAVLEPHLLLRPAAPPDSCSPSALPVPGEDLLSGKTKKQNHCESTQLIIPSAHTFYIVKKILY